MIGRLGTGWSIHSSETGSVSRSSQLTFEEQEHIMRVIRQAETLEHTEMERIGSEILLLFSFPVTIDYIEYSITADFSVRLWHMFEFFECFSVYNFY